MQIVYDHIHVEIMGSLIKLRFARNENDNFRNWEELTKGQRDFKTGLTYEQLMDLGQGIHRIPLG